MNYSMIFVITEARGLKKDDREVLTLADLEEIENEYRQGNVSRGSVPARLRARASYRRKRGAYDRNT